MKTLCTLIALVLLIAGNADAQGLFYGRKTKEVAGCSISLTNRAGANHDTTAIGFFSTATNATKFTVTQNGTVCKVTLDLTAVGSPSFNLTAYLFDDSAGSPNAVLGTSGTVAATSATSATEFTITGVSVVTGTTYWLGLKPSAAGDGSNYIQWNTVDGFVSGAIKNGAPWAEVNNRLGKIAVYAQ